MLHLLEFSPDNLPSNKPSVHLKVPSDGIRQLRDKEDAKSHTRVPKIDKVAKLWLLRMRDFSTQVSVMCMDQTRVDLTFSR